MTSSTFAIISTFDFLSFSSALCDHVSDDHSMTQNLKTLYSMHLIENVKTLRCNWYVQTKKTQKIYHVRKHELIMKSKIKQKAKKLLKQQKEIRLIKKRIEEYTCKRCKHSIKFDNNIKLHEHIRTRHAKKSKSVQQFVVSFVSRSIIFSSSASSFQSIVESSTTSFISSKFLSLSMLASEIVRERSKSVFSDFSSIETSKKSISWTEIVSRFIVAFKLSRFSIATLKSMCKFSKNANVVCSSISSRISSSKHQDIQKLYFTMNDLFRMFVEKSNSFDLQQHQTRSFFSRDFDKCNFKNNCKFDFIQTRITSYFNAMILSVFKSIKFETFASTHDSIKQSIRTSSFLFRSISRFVSMRFFFSTFSRSFFVCKHCQKRSVIYWFTDWVTSNVSKAENNEILMRQRYWSFAPSRSTLREYWSLLEEVTTLEKLEHVVCLLFARSLLC